VWGAVLHRIPEMPDIGGQPPGPRTLPWILPFKFSDAPIASNEVKTPGVLLVDGLFAPYAATR
jgi:hypothetical protein